VSTTIRDEKSVLRARIKACRAGLAREHKVGAARALAEQGLGFLGPLPQHTLVSGFASLPDELPLWPLLRRLDGEGVALALPVMVGKGRPLLFRAWQPGDVTEPGVWGIAQPTADKPAVEPDVLLVPLLAFDANGWRLGYGGGFYDRTLRALRARKEVVAVGVAYDEQRVDRVPHLANDERLDWVLTPSAAARCVD
jgi:5-formyltetrahydrofolate cyclo-ligase